LHRGILKAINDAVPVRLMRKDLQFLSGRLTAMLDERRQSILIRQSHVGKAKDVEGPAKLIMAALQKADEGQLGRRLVHSVVLLSIRSDNDGMRILRDAAQAYKVNVDGISANAGKQLADREKARKADKAQEKTPANHPSKNRNSGEIMARSATNGGLLMMRIDNLEDKAEQTLRDTDTFRAPVPIHLVAQRLNLGTEAIHLANSPG
jgi:hypothetical protein